MSAALEAATAAPLAVAPRAPSAPVSMQPSGPVPAVEATASGSGPHADLAIPQNAIEASRAWDRVLDALEERKRFSLAGPLRLARVMAWTPDHLELGFPVMFTRWARWPRTPTS